MKSNVGAIDRGIRILVGLMLICLALLDFIGPWGYLGKIVLATGVFKFCGAYALFGFNTYAVNKSHNLESTN